MSQITSMSEAEFYSLPRKQMRYVMGTDGVVIDKFMDKLASTPDNSTGTGKTLTSMTQEDVDAIRDKFANMRPATVGYRILIRPIDATKGMEAAEMAAAPGLAERGFVTKTDNQQSRETKGSDIGLVIELGPDCYNSERFKTPWCKAGDIVLYRRYEGHQYEWPPGSGTRYITVNDEDIYNTLKEVAE